METDTAHQEPAKETAEEPLPPTTGSPSSTPRTDALEVPILDTRANAIMAFQTVVEHAKKMERLYETECKDHAFIRKTLERVIRERDALICACPVKPTTMLRGENCDVPSCPKCGKMRIHSPENASGLPPQTTASDD